MKPIQSNDVYADLTFPMHGIDVASEYHVQRQDTTVEGVNVRVYEPTTDRARGGMRAGLVKYVDQQVNGEALIQHLAMIVDPAATANGSEDPDDQTESEDAARNEIGGGLEGEPGDPGGFQPVRHKDRSDPLSIALTPTSQTVIHEGVASIVATVTRNGLPVSGVAVTAVIARPPTSRSYFLPPLAASPTWVAYGTTGGSGTCTFTASLELAEDMTEETEYYYARCTTNKKSNTVAVTYNRTALRYIDSTTQEYEDFSDPGTGQATLTELVQVGDLIIVCWRHSPSGGSTTFEVTDNLGNVYLLAIADGAAPLTTAAIYYSIATVAGSCTVQVRTVGDGDFGTIGLLLYRGANQVTPLDGTSKGSTSVSPHSTGTITVSQEDSLLIGLFGTMTLSAPAYTFTPASGHTLRCNNTTHAIGLTLYVTEKLNVETSQAVTGTLSPDTDGYGIGACFRSA